MTTIGTPLSPSASRVMFLGSGELGKEVVIEAMRFGIEVIACDRYADAPAMLVANSAYVFDMRDGGALRHVVETVKPDFIVPEIEAIAGFEVRQITAVETPTSPRTVAARRRISPSTIVLADGVMAILLTAGETMIVAAARRVESASEIAEIVVAP